jgi:O-antigen/teichoic acid export membrane protein
LWAAVGGPINFRAALSKGGRELFWVLAGKFALMGANAVVMLFLAKRLDLKTYGLLVLTISGQLLISRLLMMGVDAGLVRLTTTPELRSRNAEVVTAGYVTIAFASGVLVVLALVLLPVLSRFGIPGWTIACIVIGSIGTALVDYGYSFRLARQEYPLASLAQGGTALWRLAVTTIAAVATPYPLVVFFAYHGASLCSGLLQTFLIAGASWSRPDRSLIQRLLRYSFWQGKANVIVIFSLYQGTFLLVLLDQQAATGIFGLALTVSLGFFAIYNAYFEYLLARIRSVEHISALPSFVTRTVLSALLLIVACVPLVFALARLLPWFLGPEWQGFVTVFVYLAAAMVSLIVQAPLEAACHYLLKPQLISFGWLTRAVLVAIAGLILAPKMGARGAAIAQLLGFALGFVVLSYLFAVSFRSAAKAAG